VVLRKNSFFVLVSLPPSHPSCLHRNNRGDTQSAEKKEKSVGVKNMIRFWIMSLSECRDIKKKKKQNTWEMVQTTIQKKCTLYESSTEKIGKAI
jgi:hypothetical protein